MWGAGFRDGTRTRINVNSDTQSVSRALFSERDRRLGLIHPVDTMSIKSCLLVSQMLLPLSRQ